MFRPLLLILAVAGLYTGVYLLEFSGTPLGQVPVLDGAENVRLAGEIANGSLAQEPFYRAMLYPALLALLFKLELSEGSIMLAAGFLGLLFHLANTWLIYRITYNLWKEHACGLIAAGLWAIYPVAVYFSAEPLDITFSTTLFLGALAALTSGPLRWKQLALGGILLALAVLARPHFLPVFMVVPPGLVLYRWMLNYREKRPDWQRLLRESAVFWGCGAAVLILAGVINASHSGQFKILPWQGAYNLYAANKPDANGKFFTQSIHIGGSGGTGQNPTRIESEVLFRQEIGREDATIDEKSHYWRSQAVGTIAENPLNWLGLMGRKLYYLFNDFEQYNNKTYAFHKERSITLGFNPLGWGLLLLLAVAGLSVGKPWRRTWFWPVVLIAGAYAGGVLLFFVSARFRLPLAPVLCMAAGGIALPFLSSENKPSRRFLRPEVLVALVLTALLTFSAFFEARSRETDIQDWLLTANANASLGRDTEAITAARHILDEQPDHIGANRIVNLSFYNLLLTGQIPPACESWQQFFGPNGPGLLERDPALINVRALYEYHCGERDQALQRWQEAAQMQPPTPHVYAALITLSQPSADIQQQAVDLFRQTYDPLLGAAIHRQSPQIAQKLGYDRFPPELRQASETAVQRLFEKK